VLIRQSCSVNHTTSTPASRAHSSWLVMLPVPSENDACTCIAIETGRTPIVDADAGEAPVNIPMRGNRSEPAVAMPAPFRNLRRLMTES
jgi:hypothetical protein